jgi:two-component system, NtrC family, nitrogen regulation response regulator NtrX
VKEFSPDRLKLDPEVLEILKQYKFPGNVRELKNLMERLVLLSAQMG